VANDGQSQSGGSPIADYFARLAKTYGEGEYFARRRAAASGAIAREITAARSILDLGCGNGAWLREFLRLGTQAQLTGADLSFAMLAEARRRVGARAHFAQADATRIPFRSDAFDLILCSHVLQFVPELVQGVSGIVRCLRPGGALVTTLEDSAMREVLGAVLTTDQWEEFARAVFRASRARRGHRPDDEVYRAAFVSAGLTPELREGHFAVGWPQIQEWVAMRWMPVASESARGDMERILTQLGRDARVASIQLELTERLLVGHKSAS
jgi:ubiquinone/menaquinone biosynthesis C-methylase UbiE